MNRNFSVITLITRLLSNLRPTTRECVHLVTRGYFRSRDKDGGHTIRSAVVELEKPAVQHANFMALCFVDRSYCRWKFYIAGIGILDRCCCCDLDPMTFTYELDLYSVQIYRMCENELLTHTDKHDRNYIPCRFAGGHQCNK